MKSIMDQSDQFQNGISEKITNQSYIPKTDKELKQLALDIHSNLVFTSRHLDSVGMLPRVFQILIFLKKEVRQWMIENEVYFFYEYLDKQLRRMSINGYPIFFSLHYLNKGDTERLYHYYEKLTDKIDEFNSEN